MTVKETHQMHDAVASGQRGAAGGIARKSKVDTLADCSERFGIQKLRSL